VDAISYSRALKSKPNVENPWPRPVLHRHDEHNIRKKVSGVSQYNDGTCEALRPRRFCHADSHSLETRRSRVGIVERDDIFWFRCIFGASRKGPLCARCDDHSGTSPENGRCTSGATKALPQSASDSESVRARRFFLLICLLSLFGHVLARLALPNIFSSFCFSMTSAGERPCRPSHETKSFILTSCFTGGCWTRTVTVAKP
jgi:hypothetical protein